MLAKLFLVFLVGYASASHYAWKPNTEYAYKVLGRTLTGLTDHDPTMSGILLKAELRIVPKTPEILTAKIEHSSYCRVQMQFRDSWEEEVSESNCQYSPLVFAKEAFEIHVSEGVVKDVHVSKTLHNWEANIIKSIVSQIQLNVNAKHPIDSEINVLPRQNNHFGVFKVMEETVTGEFETIYTMKPEGRQWWPILSDETHHGTHQHIIISKSKNFTNHGSLVGYHFGFGHMETSEPNTDSMGNFMNRTSISRAVILGDLQEYVIKSSNTSNVISLSPLYNNDKSGVIASKVSLILQSVQPGRALSTPSDLIPVGLTYDYDTGYGSNTVEASYKSQRVHEEHEAYQRPAYQRLNHIRPEKHGKYHLDQSKHNLDQPSVAMVHYITGFEGKAIKYADNINIVEEASKIAREIGQDLQHPNELPKRAITAKFALLVRLCRQMDKKEMDKLVEQIYTKEHNHPHAESWKTLRDAIAQVGSGPALLTIREWIKSERIDHYEASHLVATLAESSRYPTAKYLRAFQKLVEESVEHHHHSLNYTAAVSYADLLYKVCLNNELSHQHYPFHAYGSFQSDDCQNIAKEYIRYLENHLHKAVSRSDSHAIIAYSIALGHIGHRDIYRSFERYIKQTEELRRLIPEEQRVTEFQRFVMVTSLRRFVHLYPEAAREFLSSIYFSTSESEQLRSISVYLIGLAEPDTSLLTAMAQHTHIDENEFVNSAVKSTIQTLIDMDYEPASHAIRYLGDDEYGIQYSHNILLEYVHECMDTTVRHSLRNYASADHILPNGISGKLQVILGGANFNLGIYRAVLSSLRETVHALEHQTEYFHHEVHNKHSHQKDEAHSSHKVYEKLGINVEEREQVEGYAFFRVAQALQLYTMDNLTIHHLPEVVKHYQSELKSGQKFSLTKWMMSHEAVMSAPTELGIPFSFATSDPILLSLNGKIQAEAQPEISNGELFRVPDNVHANADVHALINRETHSSIRFYTPFDHHEYVSGYTKKMQVNTPITAKVDVDLKTNHVTYHLKSTKPQEDIKLFHYSTIPYSAISDLLSIRPLETSEHYIVLTQQKPHTHDIDFGKKAVGMQFHLHHESDNDYMSWNRFLQSIQHNGAVETAIRLLFDDEILYSKTEFWYKGSESVNHEVKCDISYHHKHYDNQQGSAPTVEEILNLPSEQQSRIQQVVEKVAAGIKSVDVLAGDLHLHFIGQQDVHVRAGAVSARGPVDKHSRVVAYVHTESKHAEIKPHHIVLVHNGESPNTNALDYEYALNMEPKIKGHTKFVIGEREHLSTIEVDSEFHKTQERVKYLKALPHHHRCMEQIKEGNRILPECANMTAQANLLDHASIRIKHAELPLYTKQVLQKVMHLARPCRANEFEFEHHGKHSDERIEIDLSFSTDLHHLNYTAEGIWATELKHTCHHIPVNRWLRQLLVPHPVFPVTTRLFAEALDIDTYRPICVVDSTKAATFDGIEYDAHLSDSWTVMLHYLPQFSNHSHLSDWQYRKHYQIREHVVMVRQESNGKAVKITLRSPDTNQEMVEVELNPSGKSNPRVTVRVDKSEVHYSQHQSSDFHHRAVRIYGLPNDEVKVDIHPYYYVITDGQRVKLSTTSYMFNNVTRGLCGNHNGMEVEDFLLPNGEISIESHQKFVESYSLGHPNQPQKHRVHHEHVFVPIPSFERIEELSEQHIENSHTSGCTAHRTLYFRKDDKDCFSKRAFPVCKPGCSPQEEANKRVELICLDESSATKQWKHKAEAGDYLNFENRQPNDHIETKIHSHCQH